MIALNCFGPYPFGYYPTAYDLLMFTLGSFVIISMLLFYYNRIPKSNDTISELDCPIYHSKDILLQSNSNDVSFFIDKKTTSTWVKILAFFLIIFMVFTSFQEFLGL
ncbi:hypothetical protein [Polaribacter sp. SA4-12]|uniref:hypothetical protein n=1 Tax=Polaribacter sp. SA4-12 TaxID=1312072 RepID=UPI000B3BDDFF|nr:hypothetical protein [Polaribacter sp. SA4-12]ARV15637.1 hypothetical protein BTO07_11030 [Polaribacter sp. SA4-12]